MYPSVAEHLHRIIFSLHWLAPSSGYAAIEILALVALGFHSLSCFFFGVLPLMILWDMRQRTLWHDLGVSFFSFRVDSSLWSEFRIKEGGWWWGRGGGLDLVFRALDAGMKCITQRVQWARWGERKSGVTWAACGPRIKDPAFRTHARTYTHTHTHTHIHIHTERQRDTHTER